MQADLCQLNTQILISSLTNNSGVSLTLKANLVCLQAEAMMHPLTRTKAHKLSSNTTCKAFSNVHTVWAHTHTHRRTLVPIVQLGHGRQKEAEGRRMRSCGGAGARRTGRPELSPVGVTCGWACEDVLWEREFPRSLDHWCNRDLHTHGVDANMCEEIKKMNEMGLWCSWMNSWLKNL